MQKGISLMELAQMVSDMDHVKADYIVPSRALAMWPEDGAMNIQGIGTFRPSAIAHGQMAEKLGIPKAYYDRMLKGNPELLAGNVNAWLERGEDNRLVRTTGSEMRAYLSEKFFPLDNRHIMEATLPVLRDAGATVRSAQLTERRLYLQVIVPGLTGEVVGSKQVGDMVRVGATISNSEIGFGQWSIASFIERLVCLNGAIRSVEFKRRHVGRRVEANSDGLVDMAVWSSETVEADIRAITLKARDTLRAALSDGAFQAQLEDLRRAAGVEIPPKVSIESVVTNVTKKYGLNEAEGDGVLESLMRAGDFSLWGLANAITVQAHDTESYDRNIELQEIGGKVIDLARDNGGGGRGIWTALKEAA